MSEETDDDWIGDDSPICHRCEGEGIILTCIDDICHGIGECIHGDGYTTCPNCKGKGEIE